MSKQKGKDHRTRKRSRRKKPALDELTEGSVATVTAAPHNKVALFGLEHIEVAATERHDLPNEPTLEHSLGEYRGRIGRFYLVIPQGGYAQNPTVARAQEDRVYVENNFEL